MVRFKKRIWKSEDAQRLAEALTVINDIQTMKNFLRDSMTESEIKEIASRLRAARMLAQKRKYQDIVWETKLSSRTVARISDWLKNGCGGYYSAFTAIKTYHTHTPPERLG